MYQLPQVKSQFNLANILPEQEESIREFFKGKNIFVNLPTGYGKSLIYQCLPIINDVLHAKPRGSSVIVVNFAFAIADGWPSFISE